jgi:hypothetical protein
MGTTHSRRMKKYIIFSPKYSETSGGIICLHYLAHLINQVGGEAYLCPIFENFEISKINFRRAFVKTLYSKLTDRFRTYKLNKNFFSKVLENLKLIRNNDDFIVIYPEITLGNPLAAKNVVRWLLHNPGEHTGKVYYGSGELHVKYHNGFADFHYPGATLARHNLYISYFPLHLYNTNNIPSERFGTAYCLRKGRHRKNKHHLEGAILIDGMSHEEVARVLKRVKTFISYDLYTAYSVFAVLCGCDSVVIPEDGITKEDWFPDEFNRYGVAYGFDEIESARSTRNALIRRIHDDNQKNEERVRDFMKEAENFFDKRETGR